MQSPNAIDVKATVDLSSRRDYSFFIFALLLVCYGYFFPRWADWNQNSRLDQILSIINDGTLSIDSYYKNTGDYAFYNGHYYSDKAPGSAFLGIPVYWVYRNSVENSVLEIVLPRVANNEALKSTLNPDGTGLLRDKVSTFLDLIVVSFFVVALPSALLGVLFYRLLGNFTPNEFNKVALSLALSLATPAFAYSNNYYGHQITAFLLFAAFYIAFGIRPDGKREIEILKWVGIGLLLGLSVITEYPTLLIAVGVGIYAISQSLRFESKMEIIGVLRRVGRPVIWLALGSLPAVLLSGAYNFSIYGSPFQLGYEYSVLWQGSHSIGLMSLTFPTIDGLWGITFSPYRGLFFFSPFLILAIPGFICFWQTGRHRKEFWLMMWATTSFILFNASSVMWSGGFSVGPRYLIPALPFITFPIIFFLDAVDRRLSMFTFVGLAFVSLCLIWMLTLGGQGYPEYQLNPLFDFSVPHLSTGDIARNIGNLIGFRGFASLVPLFILGLCLCVLVFLMNQLPRKIRGADGNILTETATEGLSEFHS